MKRKGKRSGSKSTPAQTLLGATRLCAVPIRRVFSKQGMVVILNHPKRVVGLDNRRTNLEVRLAFPKFSVGLVLVGMGLVLA